MICPICSSENRAGAGFCVACGTPLGGGAVLACVACNASLRPGALFCHRCGRVVVAAEAIPPPAATTAPEVQADAPSFVAPSPVAPPDPAPSDPAAAPPAETPCPHCGQANRPGARFCLACRAPLLVTCANCGADNRATARFCLDCGQPIVAAVAVKAVGGLVPAITTEPPPQPSGGLACEFCGQLTSPGARYCPHCGKTPTSRLLPFEAMYSTGMMPQGHKLRGSAGDDYLVMRLIAQGGMGAVYEVGRMTDGTRWAMKEMSETALARGDRAATVAKFQEEAELLRSLRHDNLPRVVDVFEFNRRHFLVMELIEGRTLTELLDARGGPLPEKDVVDWGAQLCRVLAFLHTRQPPIIYRDLKPDNIMLDAATGRIKLIDFGIARRFKGGKRSDTFMLGTKGYAAPEQFGKAETDGRADLFALGATLHHLLTNENPTNRRLFDFTPLESYPHLKLSRRTCEAINAVLALSPADRPANAATFYKALTGKTMPAPPPPTQPPQVLAPPDRPPVRSRPTSAMLSGRADPPVPLDLGTVPRGQSPSGSVPVAITAGALPVESRSGWLTATPEQVVPGGNEVKVTARTGQLALARARQAVTYRPRFVVDWLWWLVLRLYSGHTGLLVPAPRRHEGTVRVGRQDIAVAVTVTPTPRAVGLGRFASAAAVVLEIALVALALGLIITRL